MLAIAVQKNRDDEGHLGSFLSLIQLQRIIHHFLSCTLQM